jgi:hypothetical protein
MLVRIPSLLSLLLLFACVDTSPKADNTAVDDEATDSIHFGEEITPDEAISFDTLLEIMREADAFTGKVRGRVSSVCQTKGCWMTVTSATGQREASIFVQFEDYGFFMPFDLAGSEVVMAGEASWDTTSVDELRHYAEDAGKSPEEIAAITEPEHELKFMATGVLIVR